MRMKKIKLLFMVIALMITSGIYAQATIESIIIEKKNRNAVKLYIDQPEDITADALEAKLKRSGLSGKRNKGVTIYRGVTLSEISTSKLDIYTRVEKSGIGSVVYMAASKGYDNFAGPEDTEITDKIVAFLNSFTVDANQHSVDVNLLAQKENIEKQEKAYQKLLEEQKDTEKKKSDAEAKLVQLQNDIAAKAAEIERLKGDLESLKLKKSTVAQ